MSVRISDGPGSRFARGGRFRLARMLRELSPVDVPSPLDALFKRAFGNPREAARLLRGVLPARLAAAIDWRTLKREPGTFVDDALRSRHTDLLFSAKLGGRTVLPYLLLEHQSTVDRWMAFRALRYEVRILERWLEANPRAKALPLVIVVVVYHGEHRWWAATEVADLVDVPEELSAETRPFVPRLSFILDDLTDISDDEISHRELLAFGELALLALLRLRHHPNPMEEVRRWWPLLRRLIRTRSGLRKLTALLEYLFQVAQPKPREVRALMRMLGPAGEEAYMSFAKKLIDRGRRAGLEEGHKEGAAAVLRTILTARFGVLSPTIEARLEAADASRIQSWSERVLAAERLEDVFTD